MYKCVYIYTYIHVYIYPCIYISMYIYIHVYIYPYICIYIFNIINSKSSSHLPFTVTLQVVLCVASNTQENWAMSDLRAFLMISFRVLPSATTSYPSAGRSGLPCLSHLTGASGRETSQVRTTSSPSGTVTSSRGVRNLMGTAGKMRALCLLRSLRISINQLSRRN